jgi:hypothetical protein
MEVFRDLYISASADKMAVAVAEIEKAMPTGWSRDRAAEARSRSAQVLTQRVTYCFGCKTDGRRSAAILILAEKDPGTFYVSNIIPTERHQLAHAEYNAILEDFYQRVFKPIAEKNRLVYSFTGSEVGLENWMSAEAAEMLRQFSACANKGTGSSHPNDRERWNAFVLSAHRTGSTLDPSTLMRWLVEAEEWPPEIAEQLAVEYEYGRELLSYAAVPQVA